VLPSEGCPGSRAAALASLEGVLSLGKGSKRIRTIGRVIVYPAIDIYEGRVVRMTRGDFSTVEQVASSPLEAAKHLVNQGAEWLHIVDIDGARTGTPANLEAIRQIANRFTVKIQAGGGIRDFDTAEAFAEAGASRIVIGTAAVDDPELIGRLVDRFADGMAVAVDARNGMITTAGWTETTDVKAVDLMHTLAVAGVPIVIYTNVSVDGTLQGVDLDSLQAVARAFGGDVIYSGGVGSLADIAALAKLRHRGIRGVVVGRALYSGKFTLPQAMALASAAGAVSTER
jgi:phosphoribosylformimino-5-aminoimidazole carboxamide ribotide isomerase